MPEIRLTNGRKTSNSVARKFKEMGVKLLDQCHWNWTEVVNTDLHL